MEFNDKQEQDLNRSILNDLKNQIYLMERVNNKTKKYKNSEMVDKIRHLIERAVENDN